jgi:hypothetical protein
MPIALFIALAGSLAIHGAALFGTDVELFGGGAEPVTLQAEIKALPAPPAAPVEPPRPLQKPVHNKAPKHPVLASAKPSPVAVPVQPEVVAEVVPETPAVPKAAPPPPAKPVLPASGVIRFAIFKESLGLQVGRAEHRWEFSEDGRYRLTGVTETSGLAALIKPVRLQVESSGRLVAGGLQPDTFRSLKNGKDSNENADFDWAATEVKLSRDGSVRPIAPGSQDILSLNYQLAYLPHIADGASLGVVTGKKYERYALDSLGEEEIETPAGRFRTLHLRALTDNTTEIWIALDRGRLPVKIRFTDKKGESFEQVATEIGSP